MSQGFTPVEQEVMRRLIAAERDIQSLKSGVGSGAPTAYATGSPNLVLSGVFQTVGNTTITLTKPGRYNVIGFFEMAVTSPAAGNVVYGVINVGGAATFLFNKNAFRGTDTATLFETRMAFAVLAVTGTATVAIQGRLTSGGATIVCDNANTGIVAWRTGPV